MPSSRPPWASARLWLALFLAIRFVLGCQLAWNATLTVDEPDFAAHGIHYWRTGVFSLDQPNPPLGKLILALPWMAAGAHLPTEAEAPEAWAAHDHYALGKATVFSLDEPTRRRTLFAARALVLLASTAMLAGAGLLATRTHGAVAGAAVGAMGLVEINLLGHSALATLDVAAAGGILATVVCFERALRRGTWRAWALAGAVGGITCAIKFTVLVLGPVFIVRMLIHAVARPGRAAHRIARGAAIAPAVALLVLWSCYGFECTTIQRAWEGSNRSPDRTFAQLLDERGVPESRRAMLTEWRVPLATAIVGVQRLRQIAERGRITVLLDERHPDGTRRFFPTILALKTPVLVLACLLLGLAGLASERSHWRRRRIEVLLRKHRGWFYAVAIVGAAMMSKSTIGWRYLIPAIPFVLIAAATGVAWIARASSRGTLAVGAAALAIITLMHFGDGVAFFNAPARLLLEPQAIAADSNLDWGQTLRQLDEPEWRRYLDANDVEGALFGPEAAGVERWHLAPLSGPAQPGERTYVLSQTEYWGLGATPWEWVEPLHALPPSKVARDGSLMAWSGRD